MPIGEATAAHQRQYLPEFAPAVADVPVPGGLLLQAAAAPAVADVPNAGGGLLPAAAATVCGAIVPAAAAVCGAIVPAAVAAASFRQQQRPAQQAVPQAPRLSVRNSQIVQQRGCAEGEMQPTMLRTTLLRKLRPGLM